MGGNPKREGPNRAPARADPLALRDSRFGKGFSERETVRGARGSCAKVAHKETTPV